MKNKIWIIIFFVLFFGMFVIHINDFVFLSNSIYSDIPITHYPNLLHIQRAIKNSAQIPLWSNQIYAGTPFAANPLSGLWYLPGWLAVLFPLPLGINLSVVLHLLFGIWGLYKFLIVQGRSQAAAIFGSLSFFVGAKLISHFGAGHLTLIYAISWTPWLLYFTRSAFLKTDWRRFVFPGIVIGMIVSADPRWVIPAGLLWIIYWYQLEFNHEWKIKDRLIPLLTKILSNVFIGLSLSASVWIPLIEFVKHSSRSAMSINDNLSYSLEFIKLFGLLFPDFGGFSEWTIYPSMIILFLAVFVLFLYKENQAERIWFFIFLIGLFLSLGSTLPFISFLYRLPVFNLLRVPARFFFLSLFCLSILASFGFDYLLKGIRAYKFDRLFFLTPIVAFIVIFFAGIILITQEIKLNILWSLMFSGLSFLFIGLSIHHKISGYQLRGVLFLLLLFDLIGVNGLSLEFHSPKSLVDKNTEIYQILRDNIPFRIYSPSYAISQEEAAFWNIRQTNGIDPLQLTNYVSYFENASNVPHSGYSVTLPPFVDGDPGEVNKYYCPEINLLENLAVQHVISSFSMEHCPDMKYFGVIDKKFVYELDPVWAWQKSDREILPVREDELKFINYSPNRIEFSIQRQGVLTISEIFYPGWKVFVNGKEEIVTQDGIFRSFFLPETVNEVKMVFRPVSVMVGLSIEVITWILIIMVWRKQKK